MPARTSSTSIQTIRVIYLAVVTEQFFFFCPNVNFQGLIGSMMLIVNVWQGDKLRLFLKMTSQKCQEELVDRMMI